MPSGLKPVAVRTAKIAVPIMASLAAVAAVGYFIDWPNVLQQALRAPMETVLACIVMFWLQIALAGLRLQYLLRPLNLPVSLPTSTSVWGLSYLAGLVLPTSIGSDVVKGAMLVGRTHAPKRILAVLVLERLTTTVGLALLVLVSLPFAAWTTGVADGFLLTAVSSVALAGVAACLLAIGFRRRAARAAEYLLRRLAVPAATANAIGAALTDAHLGRTLALSTAIHALTIAMLAALLAGLSPSDPIVAAVLGGPAVVFAAMLPLSVGGFGVREGAFIIVFGAFAINASTAAAVGLAWWGVQAIASLTAALPEAVWLAGRHIARRRLHGPDAPPVGAMARKRAELAPDV